MLGRQKLLLAIAITSTYGCAVPVAPTGGPVDSMPPQIESIEPANGSTNIETGRIVIQFSEYVDEASFQRSFELTPEPLSQPSFDWKKKRVTVQLQDSLRENTTYLLTLDSNLRDRNNVTLSRPEVIAFSTGPTINEARLTGNVVWGDDGRSAVGLEVHAFIMSDSLDFPAEPRKPDYRTQTSRDGNYDFSYLAEELYYVISFDDQNKNKTLDVGEASGSSRTGHQRARKLIDSLATRSVMIVAPADTVAATVRRASSISNQRTILSFSEPIDLAAPTSIVFHDSSRVSTNPLWVYAASEDRNEIGVFTHPLSGQQRIQVAVTDSSSNTDTSSTTVNVRAVADTAVVRFQGFFSLLGRDSTSGNYNFYDDGTFGIVTDGVHPIDSIRDEISIRSPIDNSDLNVSFSSINGRSYYIEEPNGELLPDTVVVSVDPERMAGTDTVNVATFVRFPANKLGELSGFIVWTDSLAQSVLKLYSKNVAIPDALQTLDYIESGTEFRFDNLPAGTYGIDVFLDLNSNQKWDVGTVFPFVPYEPLARIPDTLRVRPRWESVLADTIRLDNHETSSNQ